MSPSGKPSSTSNNQWDASCDPILEEVSSLFQGRVGEPYPDKKLAERYKDGDVRFKQKVPPGYMDAKKEGTAKYGDVIVWFQLLDKAKADKKPIVFVTDDRKEDWWFKLKHSDKTHGPRPELRKEMYSTAQVEFYMYNADRFMEFAREHLKHEIDQKAIDEVRKTRTARGVGTQTPALLQAGSDFQRFIARERKKWKQAQKAVERLIAPIQLQMKEAEAIRRGISQSLKLGEVFRAQTDIERQFASFLRDTHEFRGYVAPSDAEGHTGDSGTGQ